MQANQNTKRFSIDYFEGINSLVAYNLAKKYEFAHAENVRSETIGVMEKRQGSTLVGGALSVLGDYGLVYFPNSGANNKYLYRVSEPAAGGGSTIYYLSNLDVWTALVGSGAGITNGQCDFAVADNNLFIVNYNANNRYISSDGTTVVDSSSTTGHLYNSPKANNVAYYKGRLYLADFQYGGVRYGTTMLRSSQPLGIVALVNGDPAAPYTSCNVTDTKYVYTTAPGNTLDVYRGVTKIAVLTVTAVSGYALTMTTAFEAGQTQILSADELWAPGSFGGAKQYRWVNNASSSGAAVKEYDTFRLAGGDGSNITMLETIGNVLMVANKTTIGLWNDYTLQSYDFGVGCISKKGFVKNLGALYFIHYTGIYATNGDAPKLISSKVERYINGATKAGKEASSAGKKGRSVFFTLGAVTLTRPDGSVEKTLNDVVLEYAVTQEDWYVHTNVKATDFETFMDATSSDRLVFTSTITGNRVLEFLSGETDNNEEIMMRGDTQPFPLSGQFEKFVQPLEVLLDVERGAGIKVFVSLDLGPFYELEGEAAKGSTILKIQPMDKNMTQPVRCRNIRLSIRHSAKQLAKINRVAITFNPTVEEEQYSPNIDA